MNSNSLTTTAVGGALVVGKLATISGSPATGIATATGGVGITTVATVTASVVAIAPVVAVAAPIPID